jgi:hypothetical protein
MALPVFALIATANTWTQVHAVTTGKTSTFSINVAGIAACKVKVALTTGTVVGAANVLPAHTIESLVTLPIGGVLERTGITLPADCKVWVQADVANAASVAVYGIEE